MLTENEKANVVRKLSISGVTRLGIEQVSKLANETKVTLKSVEWCALDNGIELLRYQRNLGTLGFDGQKKLLEGTIVICGLGGLGGHIAEQCARAGVGKIIGVDYDVFDETNLNRQILSGNDTLGEKKTGEAKKRIEKINPAVEFKPCSCKFADITADNWENADIVFDCLDNIPERMVLAEKCALHNIPMIHGAIAGWYGQVAVVWPGSKILDIIYKGQKTGIESESGTPPFTAATTASIMVSKGIKILAGIQPGRKEQILFFDLLDDDWQTIKF